MKGVVIMKKLSTCLKVVAFAAIAPVSIACSLVGAVTSFAGASTCELVHVIGKSIITDIEKTES